MLDHRFTPYLVVAGLIALISVCYIGYREYQKHTEFEAFISKVQSTLDNDANPPEQTATPSQGTDTGAPVSTTLHRIDASVPPIQVGIMSKEDEETAFEPIDWSKVSPELRSKWEHFDPGPMTLQRIQTPNGNVHFIELPAGIDYSEVDITASEEMAHHSTLPPTGSFDEMVSVKKSDIPEGEDVEEYIYKKRWALFLDVSVEEVGKQIERGHLPPRPSITERAPVIEFPIEALIGDDNQSRSSGSIDNSLLSREYRAETSVSFEGGAEDVRGRAVRSDMPQGVKSVPQDMADFEKQLTPEGTEARLKQSVSADRYNEVQRLIKQYGTEEGLRRLRESDPEAARQFESDKSRPGRERLRSESPQASELSRDAPNGTESER